MNGKKYRLDESLIPLLVPSLSPLSFSRRTMRGKVYDRRKKWTAAIMEFRATRVVLLPPPQRSLVQKQLCWMNQWEEERERQWGKRGSARGEGREGAFTTSGLDFFSSLLLSRCLPLHFFPFVDVSPPRALAKRYTLSTTVPASLYVFIFLVIWRER